MIAFGRVCVVPVLLWLACCCQAAEPTSGNGPNGARASGDAKPPAAVGRPQGRDLFADLRSNSRLPGAAYWREVGRALRGLQTLESATWSPETGTLLLSGQPSETGGPYYLDDLMVILRGVLFEKQAMGMSIDPADPQGKRLNVRYEGGSADTAVGWLLFECDRLLKCYSQGVDNLTGKEFRPENIADFVSMIDREAATGGAKTQGGTRFWLTPNLLDKQKQQASKSDRFQPVALVSEDKRTIYLEHLRIYVRSVRSRWDGTKYVDSPEKNPQAEQFSIHFSNHYDEFAREQPVFARLKDLARLQMLAEWIREQKIPLDVEFIRNYQPQTPVKTPRETPAIEARRQRVVQQGNAILTGTTISTGGVDLSTRPFFAVDNGTATRRGKSVVEGHRTHRADAGWTQDIDGQMKSIVVLPTAGTRLAIPHSADVAAYLEARAPQADRELPDGYLPPPAPESDRSKPGIVRDISSLKEYNERGDDPNNKGPPRSAGAVLAVADRSDEIPRDRSDLFVLTVFNRPAADLSLTNEAKSDRGESAPPRLTDTLSPPDKSSPTNKKGDAASTSPAAKLQPGADAPSVVPRLEEPLIEKSKGKANSIRGPPGSNAAGDRSTSAPRDTTPLSSTSGARSEARGKPAVELPPTTLNLPRVVMHYDPKHTAEQWIENVPDSKLIVPDQLAIVSELGDINVSFSKPQIDQARTMLYCPANPPGRNGIRGFYPKTNVLEFVDGRRIAFGANGYPVEVTLPNASRVRFEYAPPANAKDLRSAAPVAFEVVGPQPDRPSQRFALVTTAERREKALAAPRYVIAPPNPATLPPTVQQPSLPPAATAQPRVPQPAAPAIAVKQPVPAAGSPASPAALHPSSSAPTAAPATLVPKAPGAAAPDATAPAAAVSPVSLASLGGAAGIPAGTTGMPRPTAAPVESGAPSRTGPAGASTPPNASAAAPRPDVKSAQEPVSGMTIVPAVPLLDESAEIRFLPDPAERSAMTIEVLRPSQQIDPVPVSAGASRAEDASPSSPLIGTYRFREGGRYVIRIVDGTGAVRLSRDVQVDFKTVPVAGQALELSWRQFGQDASQTQFQEAVQLLTSAQGCRWNARLRSAAVQTGSGQSEGVSELPQAIVVRAPDGSTRQLRLAEQSGFLPPRAAQRLMLHATPVSDASIPSGNPVFVDVTLTWEGERAGTREFSVPLRIANEVGTARPASTSAPGSGALGAVGFVLIGGTMLGGLFLLQMRRGPAAR